MWEREREREDEKVERRWSKKERGSRRLRRKRKSDIDGRCAYAEERREGVNGKKGERNEVSAREMEAYVGPDGSERDGVSQARRMLLPAVARFWDRLGSVESGQSSGRWYYSSLYVEGALHRRVHGPRYSFSLFLTTCVRACFFSLSLFLFLSFRFPFHFPSISSWLDVRRASRLSVSSFRVSLYVLFIP